MKKFRRLPITFVFTLLLATATFAGDMHSDSKGPGSPTTQLNAPPTSEATSSPSAEYLDVIIKTIGTLLNALRVV